jgi:hypothetical protein
VGLDLELDFESRPIPSILLIKGFSSHLSQPEWRRLAYAADSKPECIIFCSLRNSSHLFETKQENSADALTPFAVIFEHFEAF